MAENEMDKRGYNSKLELLGAHFDGWVFRGHVVPSLKLTACLPLEIWLLEDDPFLLGQSVYFQVRTVCFRDARWKKLLKDGTWKNKKHMKGLDLR